MARIPTTTVSEDIPFGSFDVLCKVGTVVFGDDSTMSPTEAAFLLIARHEAEGEFTFPAEDGRLMTVTVEMV